MRKWDILKNVLIEKLVFWWKGFARLKSNDKDYDGKTIFVTGWCVPRTIADLRVLKSKRNFIETQIFEVVKKSPLEKKHPTNVYGMSGGWKRIDIDYSEQLKIKWDQVREAFFHLEKLQKDVCFDVIEPSPVVDGYRNKVEFSFGKFISARYNREEHFNLGFHKQWEFSKIEDFDGCPLIDEFQNSVFREIKEFTKKSWLPVYDSMRQQGFFRHLVMRKTHFGNEMMIILWFNDSFLDDLDSEIGKIKDFFWKLCKKYKEIKSVYLSYNSGKGDVAIGNLELICWDEYIVEELHGLKFHISPKSFFQTNSSGADSLYGMVVDYINGRNLKDQVVLDLYGGTGTIGMIFAKAWAKKIYSVEMVESASLDGENNASLNGLKNIDFVCAKVEVFLGKYLKEWNQADLLIIDPPRVGMHPDALPSILEFGVNQIIYVSCNPATLVRDLEYILSNSDYRIEKVGTMDMFPHTHHIETVVSLVKDL
jgi:23S rRNA (uracil1939-C5)-methyltransferase